MIVASAAAVALLLFAAAASAAAPFVAVHATLKREDGGAVVEARVVWDAAAAQRAPDYMTEGDLRLVAVSEQGHHPTVLDTAKDERIADDPTWEVTLHVAKADEGAIAAGNRVVLTASQHRATAPRSRNPRTYVTVAQLQPFGSPQDRIGRLDCADVAIEPGAKLNGCDLVGADLDHALVSRREPAAAVSRMLLADLTGATMSDADLSGLSVAGGRLNGADASEAVLDNLSLAGAEATGLDAHGATSGQANAGANIFDANLTGANFRGATLVGVSLSHSRFDDAHFEGATWTGVEASTASFRGADLQGLKGAGAKLYFADFSDADLRGAPFKTEDLAWASLCNTVMPAGRPEARENRDCRANVDPGPAPGALSKVVVEGSLRRSGGGATITAKVTWNAAGIAARMSAGDLRAVAIDGSTGVPKLLGAKTIAKLPATTEYELPITDPELLAALEHGNRVVLTATQHPPLPSQPAERTNGSYVTVDTLQAGPGRGRVGFRDCSALLLTAANPTAGNYDFCDLPGAVLSQASLAGSMREADLSGAELSSAGLEGVVLDGAALGGADLSGAKLEKVSLIAASAPRLMLPKTRLVNSQWRASNLDRANFAGDSIAELTFAASSLRGADFGGARLDKVDLGFARLQDAVLAGVDARSPDRSRGRRSSLFLADLTGANLAGSDWDDEESGDRPWQWATLCHTALPDDAVLSGFDGDRDCPAPPTAG